MFEILFKGKRNDNGEWVEGCGIIATENWVSIFTVTDDLEENSSEVEEIEVIPETVGEYIGKDDIHGTKMFEHDIVRITMPQKGTKPMICESEIFYNGCSFCVKWFGSITRIDNFASCVTFEIIGNIHDNGEMLETAAKPAAKNIAQSGLAPATDNFELAEG